MTSQPSSKKVLIIAVLLVVCALGSYIYTFYTLMDINNKVVELAAEVSMYSETNDKLSALQFALKNAQQGMKEIDEYYVPADGAVDFISVVETLAKTEGITMSVDSVNTFDVDAGSKDFQERLVLQLKTEGPWAETEQFLQLIENLPYNVYLEEADLSKLVILPVAGMPKPIAGRWKGEFQLSALKLK